MADLMTGIRDIRSKRQMPTRTISKAQRAAMFARQQVGALLMADIEIRPDPDQIEWMYSEETPADGPALDHDRAVAVTQLLGKLRPKDELVLRARFGLGDENGEPMTLDQVGVMIGVTRERVRQIEQRALRRLRSPAYARTVSEFRETFNPPRRLVLPITPASEPVVEEEPNSFEVREDTGIIDIAMSGGTPRQRVARYHTYLEQLAEHVRTARHQRKLELQQAETERQLINETGAEAYERTEEERLQERKDHHIARLNAKRAKVEAQEQFTINEMWGSLKRVLERAGIHDFELRIRIWNELMEDYYDKR